MPLGVSLYLDVARFIAAMIVFLGHAGGRAFTGGLLWPLGSYLQEAVIIFFVISGFVIAHVMHGREKTVREYLGARSARLYSVVLPALVITAVCDAIGLYLNASFYYNGSWGYPSDGTLVRYTLTALLLNEFWVFGGDMEPGINVPFWSLSFEAAYYLMAAIAVFADGWRRIALLAVLALMAGPSIIALAPVWLLGAWLYITVPKLTDRPIIGVVLAIVGFGLLVISPKIRALEITLPLITRKSLLADYFDALAFAIHLLGAILIGPWMKKCLDPGRSAIRWAASLTFALYLFHRPLIQLFAVLNVGDPSSPEQRLWLLGATFVAVATVGRWCERRKNVLRSVFCKPLMQQGEPFESVEP